jgi:uncharacterized membrane protein
MIPFFVFVFVFVLLAALGHWGVPVSLGWWTALRYALAAMFFLTASAHWGSKRQNLIRMVPPSFPRPGLLVTITGILEILGAIGLLWTPFASYAAALFFVLLIVMFPANIHAAKHEIGIGGRKATPLIPRTLMQIVFLAATALIWLHAPSAQ